MRTSTRNSGSSESGSSCKPRLCACAEWTSELQGETYLGVACAGAATVSRAKVSGLPAYLMSGAGFFTPVASPAGVFIKKMEVL
jgi:hypothetical protein